MQQRFSTFNAIIFVLQVAAICCSYYFTFIHMQGVRFLHTCTTIPSPLLEPDDITTYLVLFTVVNLKAIFLLRSSNHCTHFFSRRLLIPRQQKRSAILSSSSRNTRMVNRRLLSSLTISLVTASWRTLLHRTKIRP